ncbi:MAG: hypothetical protein ABSH56_26365 [Bryobacteraceae bacterium]
MRLRRSAFACLALLAVNAAVCWPLFTVEYLDDFQSNEGFFIAMGKFLRDWWPHAAWFPWFDGGMPFENTYLPLTGALVAMVSWIGGWSPAHAYHIVMALAYSLAPVFLFLFAKEVSGRFAASFAAALLWSILSPGVLIPRLAQDLHTLWGLRRLRNIVFWGEGPHNIALCLLPAALWLMARYLKRPGFRRFGAAGLAVAAVMLTNAFGILTVSISAVILLVAWPQFDRLRLAATGGLLLAGYLVICRFLPPAEIRLLAASSQVSGGDFRYTFRILLLAAALLAVLAGLAAISRRWRDPMLQFAAVFSACFGGVVVVSLWDLNLLPQALRYHIEMEAGLCLVAAFAGARLGKWVPSWVAHDAAILSLVPISWIVWQDCGFARRLIQPADIARSAPFRQANFAAAHLHGQRIMVAGESQWWFNLFAENSQLSGGFEPTAPNWVQQVAVYTIDTGQNAGAQDGPISVLWLKAFGCGAIVVPGPGSADHYHPVRNPGKFDGLLPLAWREAGDSIYQVPLRSVSLAHVVPASALVANRPAHGLDVAEVRRYVAALEDPALPPASLTWDNPTHGRLTAVVNPPDVLSLQVTYDPGWRASSGGQALAVGRDALGFMVIQPRCSGDCAIDLAFDGGFPRRAELAIGVTSIATLLGLALFGTHLRDYGDVFRHATAPLRSRP